MSLDERPTLDPHPLSPYFAWAGKRNRDPILDVFKTHFPKTGGHVLELASGSGMHIKAVRRNSLGVLVPIGYCTGCELPLSFRTA